SMPRSWLTLMVRVYWFDPSSGAMDTLYVPPSVLDELALGTVCRGTHILQGFSTNCVYHCTLWKHPKNPKNPKHPKNPKNPKKTPELSLQQVSLLRLNMFLSL